jgi:hypothetical protein
MNRRDKGGEEVREEGGIKLRENMVKSGGLRRG